MQKQTLGEVKYWTVIWCPDVPEIIVPKIIKIRYPYFKWQSIMFRMFLFEHGVEHTQTCKHKIQEVKYTISPHWNMQYKIREKQWMWNSPKTPLILPAVIRLTSWLYLAHMATNSLRLITDIVCKTTLSKRRDCSHNSSLCWFVHIQAAIYNRTEAGV